MSFEHVNKKIKNNNNENTLKYTIYSNKYNTMFFIISYLNNKYRKKIDVVIMLLYWLYFYNIFTNFK